MTPPEDRVLLNTTPGMPRTSGHIRPPPPQPGTQESRQQLPKVRGSPHYTLKQNTMVTNGTLEVSSLQR